MKTSDLIGPALDWAVAKACDLSIKLNPVHGFFVKHIDGWEYFVPSSDWSQGGPIIEREKVCLARYVGGEWRASMYSNGSYVVISDGPTPLIAAMRCFVASKLGDEVGVPKELL